AQHLTGFGVEGCVQRQGAVAVVLEAMPFGPSRRQRQYRVGAGQRPDRSLLVHTKYPRMLRRIEIQPDDVSSLTLEIGVVRRQVTFQPMRLDPMPGTHQAPVTGRGV